MRAAPSSDLVIIGAGLAGIAAATGACRRGYSVTLISARDRHPADFRGEKLGVAQMAALDRLGLGDAARAQLTAFDGVWTYRFGRLAAVSDDREYASDYADLVNALGDALPQGVDRVTGRVAAISTGVDCQVITLADGRSFSGRLLVVATGLGDAVRRMLGIETEMLNAAHSLSIGFDLAAPARHYTFPSMVWGQEADNRLSYLTLFPIGETMRGNLFVYRDIGDDWTRRFRANPTGALIDTMPALARALGPVDIAEPLAIRPIDVTAARGRDRDGVVLLGDAFSTVCPITGLGMAKALNDADLLANVHLPAWLGTKGMSAKKLASFYDDPAKTGLDQSAMRSSLVGRKLQLAETSYWRARRLASTTLLRLRDRAERPAIGVA